MPDEETEVWQHPIDKMLAAEEAEIAKLAEGQETTTKEVETPPLEAIPESPAPEPTKEPEPEQVKEPEPEVKEPVREAEPEKEAKGKPSNTWKQLREAQREKKALEARLAELEARQRQEQVVTEEPLDDPIAKVEKENQELNRKIEAIAEAERQRSLAQQIDIAERDFERQHSDYRDAMNFLVQNRIEELTDLGAVGNRAAMLIKNHPEQIEQMAVQTNKDPDVVATELAKWQLIQEDRLRYINETMQSGGNIPDSFYKVAVRRGWKNGQEKAAAEQPAPQQRAAQERVQKAKEVAAASQSLSAMQTTGPKQERTIRTRAQLLAMDDNERGKFIDAMDSKFGPGWVENLEE